VLGFRQSSERDGLSSAGKHSLSKLSTAVKENDDVDDDDDGSEVNVYRPNLHLEDVNMLHDPATAPAAYRKAISGSFA